MKKKSKKGMVEVYKDVYAKPFYEMEVYGTFIEGDYTEEELKKKFEEEGNLPCGITSYGVAYYATKEEAFDAYINMFDDAKIGKGILAMHLREKVMSCMLRKDTYVHEWCYDKKFKLLDESILGNYDDNAYYFGRPAKMVHHKKGDIVQYIDCHGKWFWGVVYGPSPTLKQIKSRNKHLREMYTGDVDKDASFFWYAYDSYLIMTGKGDDADFALPPQVFKPMTPVPDFVKDVLTETITREGDKGIYYY